MIFCQLSLKHHQNHTEKNRFWNRNSLTILETKPNSNRNRSRNRYFQVKYLSVPIWVLMGNYVFLFDWSFFQALINNYDYCSIGFSVTLVEVNRLIIFAKIVFSNAMRWFISRALLPS